MYFYFPPSLLLDFCFSHSPTLFFLCPSPLFWAGFSPVPPSRRCCVHGCQGSPPPPALGTCHFSAPVSLHNLHLSSIDLPGEAGKGRGPEAGPAAGVIAAPVAQVKMAVGEGLEVPALPEASWDWGTENGPAGPGAPPPAAASGLWRRGRRWVLGCGGALLAEAIICLHLYTRCA